MTHEEALAKMKSMSAEDVAEQIHPYVARGLSDSDAEYMRKMLRFLMALGDKK